MKFVNAIVAIAVLATACQRADVWKGGFESPEALGVALVDALNRGDRAALDELTVGEADWKQRLWPQFPMSAPENNVSADDAWTLHAMNRDKRLSRALQVWSNQGLSFRRLSFQGKTENYKTFELVRDTVVEAETPMGEIVQLTFPGAVVKWGDSYRLLSFRD